MIFSYKIEARLDELVLTGYLEKGIPFSVSIHYSQGENPNDGYRRTEFLLIEATAKKLRETYPGQEIRMIYGKHGN